MTPKDGQEFRRILRRAVVDLNPRQPCALLFSGGTDSLTVLWTLLDLGIKPTCYTFRLQEVESTDSRVATRAAKAWNVPHRIIAVPSSDLSQLAQEVAQVVQIIRSGRKTHVEVMWAYWHLFQAIEEQQIWSGLQADTLYGSSKSMAIKYGKADLETFTAARKRMIGNPDQEGLAQAQRLSARFGKEFCAPYTDEHVRSWMFSHTWAELQRPKQKMPAVFGFNQEFRKAPIYRVNDNLQCGSGIREAFARLRENPAINTWGHRAPAKLYTALGEIG